MEQNKTFEHLFAIMREAQAIIECRPSKDSRSFASSTLHILKALQEHIADLEDDADRYQYIAMACTIILPDGTECEDESQLDRVRK